MNGSNYYKCYLMIFIFLSSCVNRFVLEHEGEALFLLYRGVPRRAIGKISIWKSPQQYVMAENKYIASSTQQLLSLFEKNYLVLRLGDLNFLYTVDKITYADIGERLDIQLMDISGKKDILNDIGYPIFVQQKNIKKIIIFSNDIQIYQTNLLKTPL